MLGRLIRFGGRVSSCRKDHGRCKLNAQGLAWTAVSSARLALPLPWAQNEYAGAAWYSCKATLAKARIQDDD
jgi:hypothetical protein